MDFYFCFYKNTELFYCYSRWSSLAIVNRSWPTEAGRHCFHHKLVYPWSFRSKSSFWLRISAFCYFVLNVYWWFFFLLNGSVFCQQIITFREERLNGSILKARVSFGILSLHLLNCCCPTCMMVGVKPA